MNAIETKNLTKKFKDKTVVNNLNLTIKKGELFSLLGTNGAGKTTTIKMISSLILPTSGEILVNDKVLKDNIQEIRNIENLKFMAGVYEIKEANKKINELVEIFNLSEVLKQKAKTLSGGWQRKLSIALSLINEPVILFLDEPTLGLDVIARRDLWKIIEKLKGNITIILTTHYMEEAEALSDRIGIMANGHLVCTGTGEELIKKAKAKNFEDAFVSLATGGEE